MSFTIIDGRQVENLEEPDFFEPKPVSPKYKKNTLFADNAGNIRFEIQEDSRKRPVIRRRRENVNFDEEVNVLGKRKFTEAFGFKYGDEERYGQQIGSDFFATNIGHGVRQEEDILDWCYKYLASKNITINK